MSSKIENCIVRERGEEEGIVGVGLWVECRCGCERGEKKRVVGVG